MKSIQVRIITLFIINCLSFITVNAQVAINEDGSSADTTAMLDISSDSKGILIPRMTTAERTGISSPATSLLVYDTDFNSFWYYANSDWNNLSNVILADTDADTKIQVEESSDEDIIRFDLGGTEFMRLDNGRIEISNTGNSIFLGSGAGLNDDYTNNQNVFIGTSAGYSNTIGYRNSFTGVSAGYSNLTGLANSFLGYEAGYSNIAGNANSFLGYEAGYSNTTGNYNSFLGVSAGYSNTTGSHNLVLGLQAGYENETGSNNIFVGYQAGYDETGSNKLYIENSDASSPLIYGEFDNNLLQINGILNIGGSYDFPTIDGAGGQILTTDGGGTAYWSDISATVTLSDIDNDTKIQVEESSDEDIIRFDIGGVEYLKLDSGRIEVTNTGQSIFIGEDAGANDDYSDNQNVSIGYQAGYTNTTGRRNVSLGHQAGYENIGSLNVFTGYRAGYSGTSITTGSFNVFTGYEAGYSNTDGDRNSFIGYRAGHSNTTGGQNTIIGANAGYDNTTGERNVFIGYEAGYSETGSDKLYIDNSDVDHPLIYGDFDTDVLEFNGDVGVGITPSNAKFEVSGSGNALASYTYGYLNSSGTTGTWTNEPVYSIYADNKIAGFSFHAHSDERIKNIQGISNAQKDLNTLMNIEITNYTLKDKISNGNQMTKKVIAQQVKNVYPQAVSTNTTEVIPDIYQTASINENGWINLQTDLKVGEKVKIIFDDSKELFEILETKEDAFRVKLTSKQQSPVFVYGRQVDDFHTVDYEAISMLNVSATQQLAKENEALKERVANLEGQVEKVNQLEQQNAEMKVMLEQIQAQLSNTIGLEK